MDFDGFTLFSCIYIVFRGFKWSPSVLWPTGAGSDDPMRCDGLKHHGGDDAMKSDAGRRCSAMQ